MLEVFVWCNSSPPAFKLSFFFTCENESMVDLRLEMFVGPVLVIEGHIWQWN
jgi:hypothetical protein